MNHTLKNLLTDVAGLKVGNADDPDLKSGVTVVLCEEPSVASCHVMGGAPGTRETDMLAPEQTVEAIDAIVLSGGSAFGLDAASGVTNRLAAIGRGFEVGSARVPLVPAAILFDLINGGDKDWGAEPPYRQLGAEAFERAGSQFELGSVGAGAGATCFNLKGGLGSASARLARGGTVAALAAANPIGQVTIGETGHFWASPFEQNAEFGGLGAPSPFPPDAVLLKHKLQARETSNTAIAVVATDLNLTKAQARKLSVMAHDGIARSIWPSHTPYDGDIVFAISTGRVKAEPVDMIELGAMAAACLSRAVARGIYEATPLATDLVPTWRQRHG
jgi:L-aminopeptidase/D-esterase-like protein